jgi:hypothetical protein
MILGPVNPSYKSNSRLVLNPSFPPMVYEKPEESQKNSNFNGKTIPYPGFEPGTSGLAVGSHNHCTIGLLADGIIRFYNKIAQNNKTTNKTKIIVKK